MRESLAIQAYRLGCARQRVTEAGPPGGFGRDFGQRFGGTGLPPAQHLFRLGVLRRAWINVDKVWAVALIGAGAATALTH